ncbi:MAG: PIN domain nuclease [Acetobacteraceae bacterium]
MIVVDSSVWITWMRRGESRQAAALQRLVDTADDEILVGDLVLLELLQGSVSDSHAMRVEGFLRQFQVVPMMSDEIAVAAARHFRLLRSRGVTVRKTVDLIIGTFCIAGDHALLHADRDFMPMVTHLGLEQVAV